MFLNRVGRATLFCVAAILVVDLWAPATTIAAVPALIVALLALLQLFRWQGLRSLGEPIIWVLHLAYCWIPIALALKSGNFGADDFFTKAFEVLS